MEDAVMAASPTDTAPYVRLKMQQFASLESRIAVLEDLANLANSLVVSIKDLVHTAGQGDAASATAATAATVGLVRQLFDVLRHVETACMEPATLIQAFVISDQCGQKQWFLGAVPITAANAKATRHMSNGIVDVLKGAGIHVSVVVVRRRVVIGFGGPS
ncbi:hypothetical protein BC831DRAFT_284485 [Entophlyctis helioformis]|nr:hypothetical protein BC831DRAFT_284485 [Entophlyctis helioformis]